MPQISWTKNDDSGKFVERQLRALQAYIESLPPKKKMEYMKSYVYIWSIKSQIAKNQDHEERIKKLEEAAGFAQKHEPVTA